MPRRCGLGCTPTRGVLHVFPNPDKFPEQFRAWVRVVSGHDECKLDYKKIRICDRHFSDKDRNRNNRLNALAVPSLFLPEHFLKTPNEPSVSCSTEVRKKFVCKPHFASNMKTKNRKKR